MNPAGKTIVITGASQGIGAEVARQLGGLGARVAMVARTENKLRAVAAEVEGAEVFPCDLADVGATVETSHRILEVMGTPSVLVNCAGAGRWFAVDETPMEQIAPLIATPYLAAFNITRCLLPSMLQSKQGLVVNVQSPVSRVVWPGATGYAASRWALRGFTQGLRADLRGTPLGVSEVVLGEVSSTYFTNNPGTAERVPTISRLIPRTTTQQAGQAIVGAIHQEPRVLYRPRLLLGFVALHHFCPWLVRELVERTGWRRPG